MSITSVEHAGCSSYGYLVRAYVAKRVPELSKFIAWEKHGGKALALGIARKWEDRLKRKARRMRRSQ